MAGVTMVIKQFLLLSLAAEYRSRPWMDAINIATDDQMFMILTGELSWQRLRRSAADFYSRNEKSLFEPPFRALRGNGVTYALHLWLVGKPVVNFIFIVIELFSLSLTVETLWAEIGRSRHFSKGRVTLTTDFRGKGYLPPTNVGVRKLEWLLFRVVYIRSAYLVLSQYTHLTDRRTEFRQQYMQSHGKNPNENAAFYTVNWKNTPKCFCHIFHKTPSILVKFGIRCLE